MFDSTRYRIDPAVADRFVAGQHHGTLVATEPGGHPQVTLLPFVKTGDEIELHAVQADPTFAAVQHNPSVTFLVADYLAWTPHDAVDARDGGRATLHYLAVAFECEATWSTDPGDVAGALARLLAHYEPDGAYEPVGDGPFYGGRLRQLATIRLHVVRSQAKFKAGPPRPDEKCRVVDALRRRDLPGDARAADVIAGFLPSDL